MHELTCAGCGEAFEAKSPRAKWCSPRCRKRAQRKPSPAESADTEAPQAPSDEGLVLVIRRELEEASRLETVSGQLAIQLARKMTAVDATGVAGLSKELRAVLAEALDGADPPGSPAPAPEPEADDEVTRARRQREEARQAAGLA